MGLMSEIQQEQEGKKAGGIRCAMCVLSDPETSALGADEARELAEALSVRGVFASTLIEVLKRREIAVTQAQITHHRREHVEGWVK